MHQPVSTKMIWTIGHSTRSIDEFIALLASIPVFILNDIRRFPGSRRYPYFNKEAPDISLSQAGIRYIHFETLEEGGNRTACTRHAVL